MQHTTREGTRPDYILQLDGQHLFVMDAKKVKYGMHDPVLINQVYAYAYSTQNKRTHPKNRLCDPDRLPKNLLCSIAPCRPNGPPPSTTSA